MLSVHIRKLLPEAVIPEYKTPGACAFDISVVEDKILQPEERHLFSTGLVITVPADHALILLSRSSNARKGLRLANSVGLVDQDYSGPTDEIKAFLHNFGDTPYHVQAGERVMQGLLVPIAKAQFLETEESNQENRGGFGSTG